MASRVFFVDYWTVSETLANFKHIWRGVCSLPSYPARILGIFGGETFDLQPDPHCISDKVPQTLVHQLTEFPRVLSLCAGMRAKLTLV